MVAYRLEKRKPAELPGELDGDGQLDEADLTLHPEEAAYGSTSSSESDGASDASLPAGPPAAK